MSTTESETTRVGAPLAIRVVSSDTLRGGALAQMLQTMCCIPAEHVAAGSPWPSDDSFVLADECDLEASDVRTTPDNTRFAVLTDTAAPGRARPNLVRRSKGLGDLQRVLEKAGLPMVGRAPTARRAAAPTASRDSTRLSERERDVLGLLRNGASTIEIALQLGISPHTARTHLQNLLPKLGVSTRLEAATTTRDDVVTGRPETRTVDLTDSTRVVVGAPHLLDVTALAHVLGDAGIATTAVVGEALAVAFVAARVAPNVTIIDAEPFDDALRACTFLKECESGTRVLLLNKDHDDERLAQAVESGADGFLTHAETPQEMCDAVERVAGGEAAVPADMLAPLLRGLIVRRREEDEAIRRFARLTHAERRVLGLLAEGLDQSQIAQRVSLSRHTVRTHTQNVLRKLEVHSQLAAATLAIRYQLVQRFGDEEQQ